MARVDELGERLNSSTSGTLTCTSSSFTPQDDSYSVLTLCGCMNADPGTTNDVSGWSRIATVQVDTGFSGYHSFAEIWYKYNAGTGSSQTVTVTNASASPTDGRIYFHISSVTSSSTTQNGGTITATTLSGGDTAPLTLSAAPAAEDYTVYVRNFFPAGSTDPSATAAVGWSESYDTTGSGGYGGVATEWRDPGSTSDAISWGDVNVEGVGLTAYVAAAAVIKISSGGGAGGLLVGGILVNGLLARGLAG